LETNGNSVGKRLPLIWAKFSGFVEKFYTHGFHHLIAGQAFNLNIAPQKKGPSAVKGRTAEGLRRKELIDDTAKTMPKGALNLPREECSRRCTILLCFLGLAKQGKKMYDVAVFGVP
jgi:hypothetical protein